MSRYNLAKNSIQTDQQCKLLPDFNSVHEHWFPVNKHLAIFTIILQYILPQAAVGKRQTDHKFCLSEL